VSAIEKELEGSISIVHKTGIQLRLLYHLLTKSTQQKINVVVLHTYDDLTLTHKLIDSINFCGTNICAFNKKVHVGSHVVHFVNEHSDFNEVKHCDIAYLGGICG